MRAFMRNQVLGRFPAFFRRLEDSPSREVRVMAALAAGWAQTVTARNLSHLRNLTGLDPTTDSFRQLRTALPVKEVPESEQWRLGLLDRLLVLRAEYQESSEDMKRTIAMLSSLCST